MGVSIGHIPVRGKGGFIPELVEYKGAASLVTHIFVYLCVTASLAAVAEPLPKLIPHRPTST
jgi:hypothetical protein